MRRAGNVGRAARAALAVLLLGAGPGLAAGAPSDAAAGELMAINGTELWVARLGDGDPIVAVHGGPLLDHGTLRPHLDPLAADFELVFFDQRLSGRSSAGVDEPPVALSDFVADIEALAAGLGLGRIHLLAHSFGAHLALRYAVAHPERLRSLILVSPMAASSDLWLEEQQAVAGRMTEQFQAERAEIMSSEEFAARRPAAIERLLRLTYSLQVDDPAHLDRLALYVPEDYADRSRRFGALGPELQSFDLHAELAGVAAPTLLLYGASEPGATIGGPRLDEALPASRLVLIPDSGHFSYLEQPEAFHQVVRGFLRSVGSPPPAAPPAVSRGPVR